MTPTAIRELRQLLKESQAQFGQRFEVSQITIAHWESGRSQPAAQRRDQLEVLATNAQPVASASASFRPIQYLGSKQRLSDTIVAVIDDVAPDRSRVGDLFSGSGAISSLLGQGRPVTAVDLQAYSHALTSALLQGEAEHFEQLTALPFRTRLGETAARISLCMAPLLAFEAQALQEAAAGEPQRLAHLVEFGSLAVHAQRPLSHCPPDLGLLMTEALARLDASGLQGGDLTATRYFGGPYFSYAQAIALDAIHIAASTLPTPLSRGCAMAVLLSSASETVNTVGKQFAQPMKLMKPDGRVPPLLLSRALRDRSLDVGAVFHDWSMRWRDHVAPGVRHDNRVVCGDVIEFVSQDRECGMYYADPPYTIDHYSRFYHVLETLVLRDSPRLDEMKKRGEVSIMRGIYRTGRHQSSFCVPSQAASAFDRLFAATARRGTPLLLSYSPFDEQEGDRSRLLALAEMVAIAERYYSQVSVMEIAEHSHRKLNRKAHNTSVRKDAERLLICRS